MKSNSGISAVSLPLVCGAGIMALFPSLNHSSAVLFCCVAMPLATASAAYANASFSGRNTVSKSGSSYAELIFIIVLFLLAGALSYALNIILSPLSPDLRPLSGAGRTLGSIIEDLPFKDSENNALLEALLLGNREGLSALTTRNFRNAGAAHLLALSGMHLGIIYLVAGGILSVLGNTDTMRKFRSIAIIAITGLYTSMCGAGSSLLRAWLFILLNESAKMLERPQPPQHIFCAALTLHIIFRPADIADIGFQLSYLAMTGIVFIWPAMREWMDSRIWQAVSLSISCQLFTAPVTLYYFGTFPKYFMITNLIAAPLMPVVMCTGIAATLFKAFGADSPLLYGICEFPSTALRWLLGLIAEMQ